RPARTPGCPASASSGSCRAGLAWTSAYRPAGPRGRPRGTIAVIAGGPLVTVWFTVKLDDRPGSLARVAAALGDRGVNITGIVGVAEDTDGALMLTTADPLSTR